MQQSVSVLMPAGFGLVVAIVLLISADSTSFGDANVANLLGYLCVWVPMLVAIGVAGAGLARGGWGSALDGPGPADRRDAATAASASNPTGGRDSAPAGAGGDDAGNGIRSGKSLLRLSIRPIDLIWGLGVGLLARTVASLIEILGFGSIGTAGATFGETVYDGWWLFGALLAPVLLAPFVEELFFRGLVLRGVYARVATLGAARWAAPIAVGVSGLMFALMHLVTIDPGNTATVVVVGASTLIFGLAAAGLALATGRIGGAIVAHVTFNGLVIVPALLGI
ncbi:CPBP family intramembrane metalloprotease [Cryobacterium sp. TMS1-20-1]|uniref:CPBP family glutamic-type intramembrane protease n=1 Tax=Cryobacterium sp. TMS1-20-1 TaxID=1259223 RepID=UPI00106C8F73|nr:CPBP family glutamic-type intramembrane protease [Cryobacterium sp. TMS1-20-1]TFC76706.1 CPBP family intramembrane metalloprotease [Cryobacterium sp. TMS1-20-1]